MTTEIVGSVAAGLLASCWLAACLSFLTDFLIGAIPLYNYLLLIDYQSFHLY